MSTFYWIGRILQEYWPLFLRGAGVTMLVALTGTVFGFLIGLLVATVRTIPLRDGDGRVRRILIRALQWLLGVYIEVFRGTPMMVQAMIIYYGGLASLLSVLGDTWKGIISAIIILSVNTGAYMAEIIRGGIISVDRGQTEGAEAVGMTHWQTMTSIIFPQAIRNVMPSVGNEFVVNIKDSSVLNIISVAELFFQSKSALGTYYRYFETFIITAVVYFVLTFAVTRLLRFIEKRMDGPDSFVICGSQSSSEAEIHIPKPEAVHGR